MSVVLTSLTRYVCSRQAYVLPYRQGVALWGAVRQRGIIIPALFAFLWQVRTGRCRAAAGTSRPLWRP